MQQQQQPSRYLPGGDGGGGGDCATPAIPPAAHDTKVSNAQQHSATADCHAGRQVAEGLTVLQAYLSRVLGIRANRANSKLQTMALSAQCQQHRTKSLMNTWR